MKPAQLQKLDIIKVIYRIEYPDSLRIAIINEVILN